MNQEPQIVGLKAYQNWLYSFMATTESESKLTLVGPRMYDYLNRTYDPATRRNRFPGSSGQRRKMRRHQDKMWVKIGGFDPETSAQRSSAVFTISA